jgi:hypothetical protein
MWKLKKRKVERERNE